MSLPLRRFHISDAELGKKDDDHKLGAKGYTWQQRRMTAQWPRRSSMKKFAMGMLVLIGFYYFFKNMPTDLEQPRLRPVYGPGPSGPNAPIPRTVPNSYDSKSRTTVENNEEPLHNFNGPIKFYQLAATLHAVTRYPTSDTMSENVLYAAASLKSAAILLPIACDASLRGKSRIHFALMGRDDISMDILKSLNGVGKDCEIMFHDARPDFSLTSSDWRMEVSSAAAFKHINDFVHPQATIVDASAVEEVWFLRGLKERAAHLGKTVIELPENAEQNLMWITLLDSSSLSAWNMATVDFIVHAQSSATGSLLRLLESLRKADFFSSSYPRLTIELPNDVDQSTRSYLERYRWPPHGDQAGKLLTLRHRIPQHSVSSEESSSRFLEGFWPANPSANHVLVLSPQVELSPLFYHYLKYALLEYKYSANNPAVRNLLSISLDLPSTFLNDTTKFSPPITNTTIGSNLVSSGTTPFMWQAPNSNAALYFGDKWIELHDFVAHSLELQHKLPTPTTLNGKTVSKTYPSWLEYILQLARARGYWTIYPNFDTKDRFATLHNDLYQPPEEYSDEVKNDLETQHQNEKTTELGADPAKYLSLKHSENTLAKGSILNMLPNDGDLPKVWEMPVVSWDGDLVSVEELHSRGKAYSKVFRREIGGCKEEDVAGKSTEGSLVGDLFCLGDEE